MRIGHGYDVHRLTEGRKLIIGGVEIPHTMGLLGHSDADVLVHAVMDAILGAIGEGDIGRHFPDSDDTYKDIDSLILLGRVYDILCQKGHKVGNLDCTIIAQKPKLSPHISQMEENIARLLHIETDRVNVKATTTEKLGFEGEELGISAHCVCLVE